MREGLQQDDEGLHDDEEFIEGLIDIIADELQDNLDNNNFNNPGFIVQP